MATKEFAHKQPHTEITSRILEGLQGLGFFQEAVDGQYLHEKVQRVSSAHGKGMGHLADDLESIFNRNAEPLADHAPFNQELNPAHYQNQSWKKEMAKAQESSSFQNSLSVHTGKFECDTIESNPKRDQAWVYSSLVVKNL